MNIPDDLCSLLTEREEKLMRMENALLESRRELDNVREQYLGLEKFIYWAHDLIQMNHRSPTYSELLLQRDKRSGETL